MRSLLKTNFLFLILTLFLAGCSVEEDLPPNERPLGASAKDFLRDTRYTSLTVEVLYVEGFAPEATTVSGLESFLKKYLNKPQGIQVVSRSIGSPDLGTYSLEEIMNVEDEHRMEFTSGNELAAFVFIADDRSSASTSKKDILGKAYRNTSIVIFGKEVKDESSYKGIPESTLTLTTIKHEFGHLFGLVNNGTEAQNPHEDEDPEKEKHCNVSGCLMNAEINFTDYSGGLDFDEECQLDLLANGGK